PLFGPFLRLRPSRRGLNYMRKNFVFPLDVRHPIQQQFEFFGGESRTEARDPPCNLATRGRDRL
ncbi:MAG TPA: hypothetical protein VN876_08925, partial [Gemmatimonadaceae bacterium]|nr:hypothetical protein [Gemmatimonadaceae bacterium]